LTDESLNRLARMKKGEIVEIKCSFDSSFT